MASGIYNCFKTGLMKGIYNLHTGGHTIKIALVGSGYSYSATHQYWGDVSSNEAASGNGYTAGGATMTTAVAGTSSANFTTSDVTWGTSTITAYGAIIYDDTATNKPLIAWIDFGGAQVSSGGNFTISWASQSNVVISIG